MKWVLEFLPWRIKMKKLTKPSFPRSFGVFSHTGHVVMAFVTDADAERARQLLLRSGFNEDDVTHYNRDEVVWEFERSEEHALDPVQIGQEVAKVEEYLELASQGCGFLVVYVPDDDRAKHAVHLVQSQGLKFVEKYNRWTREEFA